MQFFDKSSVTFQPTACHMLILLTVIDSYRNVCNKKKKGEATAE